MLSRLKYGGVAIFSLWLLVLLVDVDELVYFYSCVSGSRAFSGRLFVCLQGQLDVARLLGLLLGVDLQGRRGQRSEVTPITQSQN